MLKIPTDLPLEEKEGRDEYQSYRYNKRMKTCEEVHRAVCVVEEKVESPTWSL